ncbi:MAG TPA: S8 family serine peptidase, partial [Candidatus Norongarragalinales archaeon]|nr:S8 family serine peptidase [Candidatus Norongarragalinales archaeon]
MEKTKVLKVSLFCALLLANFILAAKTIPSLDPQLENAQNTTIAFAAARNANQTSQLRAMAASVGLKVIQDFKNGVLKVEGNAQALRAMAATGKATLSAPRSYKPFLNESIPLVNAPYAWNTLGFKGNGVRIAILDTGINSTHPMLAGRIIQAQDFTNDNTTEDLNGHGTHVAGIAAGSNASGGTYNGVAPEALLLNAKVLDANGEGSTETLLAGISWALDPDGNPATNDGARILSFSLGATDGSYDPAVAAALDAAIAQGVVVIAASGNCGPCGNCPFTGVTFPGSFDKAITVGAVDKTKFLACFTGIGSFNGYAGKPEVLAPGVSIFSSVPDGYAAFSGTSMSTPFVSGAVALLLQAHPSLSPAQAKALLQDGGEKLGYANGRSEAAFLNVGNTFTTANDYLTQAKISFAPKQPRFGTPMQISVETVSLLGLLEGTITLPDLSTRTVSFTRQNDFTWVAAYTPEIQGDYSVRISVLGVERSAAFTAGLHSIDYPAEVFETIPAIFTVEYKNTGTTPKGAQIALEFKDYFGNTESVENSELQNLAAGAVLTQSFQLSFNSSGLRRVDSTLYVDGGIEEARTFYFNVSSPDTLETTSMQIPSLLTKGEESDWTATVNNTGFTPLNATLEIILVKKNQEVEFFYSPQVQVNPGEEANLTSLIITNSSSGEYLVKTRVHYGTSRKETSASVAVSAPSLGEMTFAQALPQMELNGNYTLNASFTSLVNATLDVLAKAVLFKQGVAVADYSSELHAVAPNETRSLEIPVTPTTAGDIEIRLSALFEGNEVSNSTNASVRDYLPPEYLEITAENETLVDPLAAAGAFEVRAIIREDANLTNATVGMYGDHSFPLKIMRRGASEFEVYGVHPAPGSEGQHWFTILACDEFGQCAESQRQYVQATNCYGRWALVLEKGREISDSISDLACVTRLSPEDDLLYANPNTPNSYSAVIYAGDASELSYLNFAILKTYVTVSRLGGLMFWGDNLASWSEQYLSVEEIAGVNSSQDFTFNETEKSEIGYAQFHPITAGLNASQFNSTPCGIPSSLNLTNASAIAQWNDGSTAIAASHVSKTITAAFCPEALSQESRRQLARQAVLWLVRETPYSFEDLSVLGVSSAYSINQTPFSVRVNFSSASAPFSYGVYVDGQKLFSRQTQNQSENVTLTLPYGLHALEVKVNDDFNAPELDYANDSKTIAVYTAPTQADLRVESVILPQPTPTTPPNSSGGNFSSNLTVISATKINASIISGLKINVSNYGGNSTYATMYVTRGGQTLYSKYFFITAGQKKEMHAFTSLTSGRNDLQVRVENQNDFNYTDNSLNATVYKCTKPGFVLAVNDSDVEFNEGGESGALFFQELREQGYCTSSWDEAADGQVTAENLSKYNFVVWSAGNYNGQVLGEEDFDALSNYSGPVLLEGADIGFDHQNGSTLAWFNASYAGDLDLNGSLSTLTLLNHQVFAGISSLSANGSRGRYPDSLQPILPSAQGIARWQAGDYAILASTPQKKMLYFAFAIESVENAQSRSQLLANAFNWLYGRGSFPPLAPELLAPPDGFIASASSVLLEYNSSEYYTRNVSFYVYGAQGNGTPALLYYGRNTQFNWTGLQEGQHSWFAIAAAGNQNSSPSETRTFAVDLTQPDVFSFGVNSTGEYSDAMFYSNASDASGLSGFVFAWDNATGEMQNGSWVPLAGAQNAFAYAVETLPASNATVQWAFYFNDTAGNWNSTGIQQFAVTENGPWWNSSFAYARLLNVTNNNDSLELDANYTANVTLDTQNLIAA